MGVNWKNWFSSTQKKWYKLNIIKKSGSWYSYNDTKLGQGRDAAKQCIQDNPELADELEKLIFDALKDKE